MANIRQSASNDWEVTPSLEIPLHYEIGKENPTLGQAPVWNTSGALYNRPLIEGFWKLQDVLQPHRVDTLLSQEDATARIASVPTPTWFTKILWLPIQLLTVIRAVIDIV